ncbi:hypothetical protein HDV05_000407 [Chytridiales sp. JEL 0842]|nr:hypothetical protein HDV05_000407 [Chytridiales sp. JEL 0842]
MSTFDILNASMYGDWRDSQFDLTFTYAESKYSCLKSMYIAHVFFCYVVFLSGIFCMITRVIPYVKWTHIWWGKIYIMGMLLATATSMLIHNTGLPLGVLFSFIWVIGGLCVGWVVISFHQWILQTRAVANVESFLHTTQQGRLEPGQRLGDLIAQEKGKIIERRTFKEKMLSYKALHGIVMFLSWVNIAGRIFVTPIDPSGFTCHTYPVYKPGYSLSSKDTLTAVPSYNPLYPRQPWANREGTWMVMLFFGPVVAAIIVGAIYSYFAVRRVNMKNAATVEMKEGGASGDFLRASS